MFMILYNNFMVFVYGWWNKLNLFVVGGGGGVLGTLFDLVAMVEKKTNELIKPDFGKDKGWWVCLLDLTIIIMIFNPYFLHLCLLKRLIHCCW